MCTILSYLPLSDEVEMGIVMGGVVVKMIFSSGAKEIGDILPAFLPENGFSEDFSIGLFLVFFENSCETSKTTIRF